MRPLSFALPGLLFALSVSPLLAQPQIGGGNCNSSSLNGTYAVTITSRQVNSAGNFLSVLQANGLVTFDGLSNASIVLTANTNQAVAMPLNWSGNYSVEANCAATLNITSGGNATLNLVVYNQGKDFLMTGSDATYSYSGSGVAQPTPALNCSVTTLNGVYTFNGTGFAVSGNSVSGAAAATGLLEFDGQGNLTVNLSSVASNSPFIGTTLTGTYTVAGNCTATATLTPPASIALSIYTVTATNTNFYATIAGSGIADSGQVLLAGNGHTAYAQPAAGTCAVSNLNGTYSLSLSGRAISSAGNFAGSLQGIGTASFDGNGNVTFSGTSNTNLAQGKAFSYTGTYTLPSNCSGALTMTVTTVPITFSILVWNGGAQFAMAGSDAPYVYSASGSSARPPACATATLSGNYAYSASGFTLSGTTQTGSMDEAGILQFDGQGNIIANYTDTQGAASPISSSFSGTYTVTSGCIASATVGDRLGSSTSLNFVVFGAHGETIDLLAASPDFVRTGSAHSTFTNPSQAIGNVASYAYSATPPGSVLVLFGSNLAARAAGATSTHLPTKLLDTTVTINGELAPLFYVDAGQIDAQMPWDIPGNSVASVIATNGTSSSNAAAVYVPSTGTPGISTYANNRAVVVNPDGSTNSPSSPASVGDEVVVYFTGGGPVQAAGKLTTGAPAPSGLSPVAGNYSITVGQVQANIDYIGLTPGSIGLYQANFVVPQISKGAYPVVITIDGYASNNPLMSVSN